MALGPNPNPEAVEAIIGVTWTSVPWCSGCQNDMDEVIQFVGGDKQGYVMTYICRACALKALMLLDE